MVVVNDRKVGQTAKLPFGPNEGPREPSKILTSGWICFKSACECWLGLGVGGAPGEKV